MAANYKNITFWFSKNTNYEDFFEWAADKVEFIDNAGKVNTASPTKIKIWYRSLNQYNLLRGLNTNTTWHFLNAQTDTKGSAVLDKQGTPVFNTQIGDQVEFIQNIDGKYLPPNLVGYIQYDLEGSYFLIDYDATLKDLKDGVKFKFKRPYACEVNKTFYEFNYPINFFTTDGVPYDDNGVVVKSFIIDGFSSYTLPRQIPVVTDVITTVTDATGTKDITTVTNNIKVYPFTFEHHSPSDTWGDHCNNGGRISFINPYEGKKCDRTQILLTGALNQENDGAINYLHYFSLADEFVLDEDGFGEIIAIIGRNDGTYLVICSLTTFVFRYNDNRAVIDEQGYVKVPTNNRFSRPERNPFENYGCQLADVNTIRRVDSLVTFLDSQRQAIVLHDFSNATDISGVTKNSGGIQSWLTPSIKLVQSNDASYWHSVFDKRTKKIHYTKFVTQYINQE